MTSRTDLLRNGAPEVHIPTGVARPEERLKEGSGLSYYQDCLREAATCLERSGKRIRRGNPEQTDEALHLLLSATVHLREALRGTAPTAQIP